MSFESPSFESVGVGDALPPLSIDITPSLIVGGAIASRDFTPVHHDADAARAQGMQNVFMNILTTNGLVSRFVTDWAGPDATIRNVKIKLGTPNSAGDTMTLTGSISGKEGDEVTVDISGKNSWGEHVGATVRVALPQ